MSVLPVSVRIVEVGARDGLQNEKTIIPAATKIALRRSASSAIPISLARTVSTEASTPTMAS